MWGHRPYSKKVTARDNVIMSILASGEGYHNFHHVFPYDYALSEFGSRYNLGKLFIDLMARLGQAYDLRRASEEYVRKVQSQTEPVILEYK